MALVANLILQSKECVIVLFVPSTSPIFHQYSEWLSSNIPEWTDFKIASHAEYLGFEVGPTAGSAQWDKVALSFHHHLSSIVCSGAPPSVVVFYYSTRRVPKCSYKSQLVPPLCLLMNPSGTVIF